MANDVFANGREISCKKADGKSICAFPDVCMTPPECPATPPGVPVPYPNTGMAKDMTKGSKKVKISDNEIMLKNKSHFKKSMGDEAGCAAKKGVVTSKNRGKVYFTAWSMDVKVEGKNVVRHLDLTTHNHASFPGNSPTWPYLDAMAFDQNSKDPCNDLAKEVEEKCEKHIKRTSKGEVSKRGRKKSIEDMCKDGDCKKARECVLSPEKPNNCCDGKTPHHLVPAHCFMGKGERGKSSESVYDGCKGYKSKKAPCICAEGQCKKDEHGELHEYFDDLEDKHKVDGKAGSWTYKEAREAAVETVAKKTKCDPDCARKQIDAYHQKGDGKTPNISEDTPLRADSSGQNTPDDFVPSISSPGGNF